MGIDRVQEVFDDPTCVFMFETPEKVRPPLVRIDDGCFSYTQEQADKEEYLLKGLKFTVDMESKIALLGANGVGKTTFLNLLMGKLKLNEGNYFNNNRARVAMFTQHHVDKLD